jgi:glyoxylase-like metal-dependent hydrolase (beta-lactamase superfamily II)
VRATLPVAARWFEITRYDDSVTHITEPHVHPMLRCNVWHVRGRDSDLLVDTGLGIASLTAAARDLFLHEITVVLTHTHYDHVGGAHEFSGCLVHRLEADKVSDPTLESDWVTLLGTDFPPGERAALSDIGYALDDVLIDHLPDPSFDPASFAVAPARVTGTISEGDVLDLGDRAFEVLHLPGHSPGSIGLWEARTGTLFSGDAVYDGPQLDAIPGADRDAYRITMERLRSLPVKVVHGGHEPSFGRERLVELCTKHLNGVRPV